MAFERLRAPTSWTRASVASLLTGLPPSRHRVQGSLDRLPPDVKTLPALLRARGYRTRGWSSNAQVLPYWGFGSGFDELVDLGARKVREQTEARRVFEAARAVVASAPPGGGFYYIHLVDPHYPYQPPAEHLRAVESLEPGTLGELAPRPPGPDQPAPRRGPASLRYLAEVRDADTELGRFLDFLRASERYDDALILVVSDHGEEFGEHGGQGHGHALYEELLRVPAVLKLPGNARAGERVTRDVEIHDLLATLAPRIGIEVPPGGPGVDALGPTPQPVPQVYALPERRLAAIRAGPWKLIVDHAAGTSRLYDLRSDPRERDDRAAEQPERVAALRALLDLMDARNAPGWHLRGCGCGAPARLAFALTGIREAPRELGLEDVDRVELDAGERELRVAFDLTRPPAPEHGPPVLHDEDELLLPGDAAAALRIPDGLPVALGNGLPAERAGSLALAELRERARVPASDPVACRSARARSGAPGCRPHLRVWYAPPPEAVAPGELDPGIAERLRALGYLD